MNRYMCRHERLGRTRALEHVFDSAQNGRMYGKANLCACTFSNMSFLKTHLEPTAYLKNSSVLLEISTPSLLNLLKGITHPRHEPYKHGFFGYFTVSSAV